LENRHIDLHLLACLEALLQEGSVTRAAQKMGMSQPGMSNALARLRQLTSDALLVRTSQGMQLTPRAHELAVPVRKGLAAMEEIFADHRPFDPAQAQGVVTIAAADSVGIMLVPRLMQLLGEFAPGVTVDMRLPDPAHVREWLRDGECDLAIGYFPDLPDGLRSSSLFSQSLTCVVRRGHPDIRAGMSMADYVNARHVVFGSPFALLSTMETSMDEALARLGHKRNQGMRVSSVLLTPYVVAQTSMVATLPTWMARHYAEILPLESVPLPFEAPDIDSRMVWHERTHQVGLHQWIREQLRRLLSQDITLSVSKTPLIVSARKGIAHVE
jgi:DNA-binding transcriptional LysR family regulator